jgi:6-phosphogluconolactonase
MPKFEFSLHKTLVSIVLAASTYTASAASYVYVSNAQDGDISAYRLDRDSGALHPIERVKAGATVMPMAVSPDRRFLYASVRSKPYSVISYAIDHTTGNLTRLGSAALPDSMANVSTDKTGRFLLSASYGGDKIAVQAIGTDGTVQEVPLSVIKTGKNAHAFKTDPSNRFAYATNLGSDQILQYLFDEKSGALKESEPALVQTEKGGSPRHLCFSADGQHAYVVSELQGTVTSYDIDHSRGVLMRKAVAADMPRKLGLIPNDGTQTAKAGQDADTRPKVWAADIHITPNGKFIYVSERTGSTISLFSLDASSGVPKYVESYPTENQPRGFNIDPNGEYLIAAGEKSEFISVYRIDQRNGTLNALGRYPSGRGANWVEVVETP